jgi:hypothetical protein
VEVDKKTENGTPFDSLRIKPGNLKVTRTASARKRLQSQVRVLRHHDGAEIMDPENMVPSTFVNFSSARERNAAIESIKLERMLAVAMATHDRLGRLSPLHALHRAEDCLKLIWTHVMRGYDVLGRMASGRGLSECALAHWPIVQSLSEEQLAEFYELACVEQWGESENGKVHIGIGIGGCVLLRTYTQRYAKRCTQTHTQTHTNTHTANARMRARALFLAQDRVAGRRCVQLLQLLSKFEECENCQAD